MLNFLNNSILKISLIVGFLILSLITLNHLWVNVDAQEIVVIQSPIAGNLTVVVDPGWKWRGFGSVTRYNRREQFSFSNKGDQGSKSVQI